MRKVTFVKTRAEITGGGAGEFFHFLDVQNTLRQGLGIVLHTTFEAHVVEVRLGCAGG